MNKQVEYGATTLPENIRSRLIGGINGLTMHVIEAGFETRGRPLVLLLHGFPEMAYSWRKIMPALAAAGFHVVAPDQRGYGRTTGWDGNYDGDFRSFRITNLVRDALCLVSALGYREVAGVFGHDAGSYIAGWSALIRPDVFRSVAMMSAPFPGPPKLAFDTSARTLKKPAGPDVHEALAKLPRPRKHYQWYYSTRPANNDMWQCPQGVHDFLRAYYHHKSADWKQNKPFPLKSWTATELEKMPTYYIMDLNENMAQTVAPEMPTTAQIAACQWLPDEELAVYSSEYSRIGFQGGLQWYRNGTDGTNEAEMMLFAGRTIDVPSCFISGKSDWGIYQKPGQLENMRDHLLTKLWGLHLLDGAGHWVQQEKPEKVSELLVEFLTRQRK
jgi:pimeloyl-ACP methyl ester carboxylesterase